MLTLKKELNSAFIWYEQSELLSHATNEAPLHERSAVLSYGLDEANALDIKFLKYWKLLALKHCYIRICNVAFCLKIISFISTHITVYVYRTNTYYYTYIITYKY